MQEYKKGCKLINESNICLEKYNITKDIKYYTSYKEKFKKGVSFLLIDARKGNKKSLEYLKKLETEGKLKINLNNNIKEEKKEDKKNITTLDKNKKEKNNKLLYVILFILLIIIFFLIGLFIKNNYDYFNKEQKKNDYNIELYFYTEIQTLETTNILRNALYNYIKNNNTIPSSLYNLIEDYPNNYLSSIPYEPYSNSSKIVSEYTGSGGYVYNPSMYNNSLSLNENVVNMINPNSKISFKLKNELKIYKPLNIYIDILNHKLVVHNTYNILSSYPIAIGKDSTPTPLGDFYLNSKVSNPKSIYGEGIYGPRALELSNNNYAIHGTNNPELIGSNVSNGCIRMLNDDIKKLYSYIPLYTPITISNVPLNLKPIFLNNNNDDNSGIRKKDNNISGNNGNNNGDNYNQKEIGKDIDFGESSFSQSPVKNEENLKLNSWNN